MHKKTEIIVVADHFFPGYTGGAEMTTHALTSQAPADVNISYLKSDQVNIFYLALHRKKLWIFTNIELINMKLLPHIAKVLNYVIVEYDFKFCGHRSPDKHKYAAGSECDCDLPGMKDFLSSALFTFYMSKSQRQIYKNKGITPASEILGSAFTQQDLNRLDEIYRRRDKSAQQWLIVYSDSWIKGSKKTVQYAVSNGLEYEIVEKLEYSQLLEKLGAVKGLIYMPNGGDTCPRLVIEARLAGCELLLNHHVMHRDEDWFSGKRERILEILRQRPGFFWQKIKRINEEADSGKGLSFQKSIDRAGCGAQFA